jgi:hypothetical protein
MPRPTLSAQFLEPWLASTLVALVLASSANGQSRPPGKPIGTVTTRGDLVLVELDQDALPAPNYFDLRQRTLRFRPDSNGFRVESVPLAWDTAFGQTIDSSAVVLKSLKFPFAGQPWDRFFVSNMGVISFGRDDRSFPGRDGLWLSLSRRTELRIAGDALASATPAIAAFLKPRMEGRRYVKELADRVVVTWETSEPAGGTNDFTWFRTLNRFQAALYRDGTITLSYDSLSAADAIVGVYQPLPAGTPRPGPTDLSSLSPASGPFRVVYETFHHHGLPRPADLACTVLAALGDRFDFLAYFADFRVDYQLAVTPMSNTGPAIPGTGVAPTATQASFCSNGRLQGALNIPLNIGSTLGTEYAPPNAATPVYDPWPTRPGGPGAYDFAMANLSHEFGHRWLGMATARVGNDTIQLGGSHWFPGLHAPTAFPTNQPRASSTMGGSFWQANGDGTFTQIDDDFYVPAKGYSHLDLYLMGFLPASAVPDFFFLRSLERVRTDDRGHPVYRAEQVKISINDVIASLGNRAPSLAESQKRFTTGFVGVVLKGQQPTAELLAGMQGIQRRWIEYWFKATGGASTMSAR